MGLFAFIYACFLVYDAVRLRNAHYTKQRGIAEVYPQTLLANSLKGLSRRQTEHVIAQSTIEIAGLDDPNGSIIWTINAPGGAIPLLLLADFLQASAEYYPHLFPIWEHSRFYESYGWKNAEQELTQVTRFLIHQGYAEKAAGNRSAKLVVSLDWLENHFKI